MNAKQMRLKPMTEDQLEHVKKIIIRIYLLLISKTDYDPIVVEVMKLSALADVQRKVRNWRAMVNGGLSWVGIRSFRMSIPLPRRSL